MTYAEVLKDIKKATPDVTMKQIDEVISSLTSVIIMATASEDKVVIPRLGTFSKRTYTGESFNTKFSSSRIHFKQSKIAKETLNRK